MGLVKVFYNDHMTTMISLPVDNTGDEWSDDHLTNTVSGHS
jgi:hypothetical protein